MSDDTQQNPGLLANILAVAGFIILIVIIVWGAYHLLRLTGSGVSSLFSRFGESGEEIEITLPTDPVRSGESFSLSWEYEPDEAGSYALLYQCKSGFRLETAEPADIAIPCGSAFTVGAGANISLVPILSGTTSLDVPLSIVFMPSATSTERARPQGTATLRVITDSDEEETPTSPTPTTGTPSTPQPTGTPDLSVRIVAVGVINPVTNLFEARYPSGPNDVAAVKFDIANNGTASTGTYYFTVNLPMSPAYTYNSIAQTNLTPGSHVENILRFKPVQSGGGTITISVDPANVVKESNESNNAGATFITTPIWTGTYQPYIY